MKDGFCYLRRSREVNANLVKGNIYGKVLRNFKGDWVIGSEMEGMGCVT